MKTPADSLRPAPEGQLPPTLLLDNEAALLNEPVYKVAESVHHVDFDV